MDLDHSALRTLSQYASTANVRFFAFATRIPALDSGDLDQLVEDLRTISDVVRSPIAVDTIFDHDQATQDTARALREVCERAWCKFVLDLSAVNDYAIQRKSDPEHVVSDFPPARVAYIRVRSTTERPITSSLKELVLSTMSRWETSPPALLLDSTRPISATLRELNELLPVSGHDTPAAGWAAMDLAAYSAGLRNL